MNTEELIETANEVIEQLQNGETVANADLEEVLSDCLDEIKLLSGYVDPEKQLFKMTEEQKKHYIEKGFDQCPRCGSSDIEGGFVDVDMNYAIQVVGCNECNLEWNDIYKLSNIDITGDANE